MTWRCAAVAKTADKSEFNFEGQKEEGDDLWSEQSQQILNRRLVQCCDIIYWRGRRVRVYVIYVKVISTALNLHVSTNVSFPKRYLSIRRIANVEKKKINKNRHRRVFFFFFNQMSLRDYIFRKSLLSCAVRCVWAQSMRINSAFFVRVRSFRPFALKHTINHKCYHPGSVLRQCYRHFPSFKFSR